MCSNQAALHQCVAHPSSEYVCVCVCVYLCECVCVRPCSAHLLDLLSPNNVLCLCFCPHGQGQRSGRRRNQMEFLFYLFGFSLDDAESCSISLAFHWMMQIT